MTAQPIKPRRRKAPVPVQDAAGPAPPAKGPGVRRSIRLIGLWLAMAPFAIGVWGGSQTVFQAVKWPFVALGAVMFTALAWREWPWETSPRGHRTPLRTLIPGEPFLTGAAMIAVGLMLSSIFSPVPGLGLLTSLRESVFLIVAVTLFAQHPRPAEVRWVLLCLLAAVAAQAALAIAQGFFPAALDVLTPGLGSRQGRAAMIGTMGNPEYLASWTAPAVAASVALLLDRAAGLREKIIPALAALLGAAMIFLSGGRGAVLALVAGLALAFVALRPRDRSLRDPRRARIALFAFAALVAMLMLPATSMLTWSGGNTDNATLRGMLPQRIASAFDLHSPSMRHRIGLYTITGRMITRDPLFGAGPGRFGNAFARTQGELAREERGIGFWSLNEILSGHYSGEAHCDPLQWWAEYGLLPFLGLTLMILAGLVTAAVRIRTAVFDHNGWLSAAWVALLVTFLTMWTSFPLHVPDRALTFWVLLGLLAGAATHPIRRIDYR